MTQLTLFDAPASPRLARKSDPIPSHTAAAQVSATVTIRQERCLSVLRALGYAVTSKQLARECVQRFVPEARFNADLYTSELNNYRKRADEIKRNTKLCRVVDAEHKGGALFVALEVMG